VTPSKGIKIRLFLTCWIIFCLHFATDFVREHYLVVSIVEDHTFDLGKYQQLHEDIFVNPPNAPRQGVHHGANPGISMIAAIPYFFTRPLVDRIVDRELAARQRADTVAVYRDDRAPRVRFYQDVRKRGLDVRFGLVGIITMVLCMAPLSALGVVGMFRVLEGAGLTERLSLWLSLLYAVGTPILFRTAYLNQNLAIAIFGLLAFLLLWNPGDRIRWGHRTRLALAGLLGGLSFLSDYSGALTLGILGLYVLALGRDRGSWRDAIGDGVVYTLGAVGPILLLWYYQWASFGNAILPPQHWMPPATIFSDVGYQGVTGVRPDLLSMLLFDSRFGLFPSAPITLLALAAPFVLWRRKSFIPAREVIVCLAITVAYVLFFASISYTRLQWSTGIRYLVPAIPFAFLAAMIAFVRLPRVFAYLVAVLAVVVGWCMAMVRNQYGVHNNIVRVFIEGFQLPWLTTLTKMSAQYAPWLEGRASALPAMALCAAVIAGIWLVRSPWSATSRRDW
jgi:hypothetical protein